MILKSSDKMLSMTTPMMLQWKNCKQKAGSALVLFRLGDFYEAFYEDAEIIAKAINLTLTKRADVPMCGVPVHTFEGYLDKLLAKGFKIAIAEQMENPKDVKGIVKRDIVRVVSPGTIISSNLLEAENNFFISLSQISNTFALCTMDLTTSEFNVLELEDKTALINEIYRLRPVEVLVSTHFAQSQALLLEEIKRDFTFLLNEVEVDNFDQMDASKALSDHFSQPLSKLGLEGMPAGISAAGALLSYLKKDLHIDLAYIKKLSHDKLSGLMSIDKSTLKNLDIISHDKTKMTLFRLLDQTETPMGKRRMASWVKRPLLSLNQIEQRQNAVESFTKNVDCLMEVKAALSKVRDLERLILKIQSGYVSPRDLMNLKLSLEKTPLVKQAVEPLDAMLFERVKELLHDPSALVQMIEEALVEEPPVRLHDSRVFKPGHSDALDELYTISTHSKDWLKQYQMKLRDEYQIKTLKVGYTRVFGYYIDISKAQSAKVPDFFERKQTLVNSERFITEELKEFEQKVLSAEEKIKILNTDLFEKLRKRLSAFDQMVKDIAKGISVIDVIFALGKTALEYNYVKPHMTEDHQLKIVAGRHPLIEKTMGFSDFIPNDTTLDQKQRLYLITGPNMAGKSTYIRQVALITIMAQIGSFVPADKAEIGLTDQVFSRVGAGDDISRGQSTFMVEMTETAHILNHATDRSLVILDEIGRGTSTYDGISIAWAVAEFLLTKSKAKTLFATHYWELTQLEEKIPGAVNFQIAVKEEEENVVFLRKIIKGGTDKSYGIHVASLAGLPLQCLKTARKQLAHLEQKRPSPKKEKQLSFFEKKPSALEELEKIDVNLLTPIEAHSVLYKLQKLMKKDASQSI